MSVAPTPSGPTSSGTASDRLSPLTSQAVFRVLLESLARPGRVLALPADGAEAGPGIVPLALAVIGSKVSVAGEPWWQERICRATGAQPAGIEVADMVAIYGKAEAETVSLLRRGSAAAPEDGAKVGLACGTLSEGTLSEGVLSQGALSQSALSPSGPGQTIIELSGPGVPGRVRLGVDGVGREVFGALREANAMFPAGVDVWLVDANGRVAGLPRSARLAVV
jgi:alpha-D-ribose 1-methylphosphonate 5-triphosphate synthase subunit PhnH